MTGNGNGNTAGSGNGRFYFSHTFLANRHGSRRIYHWVMNQKPECGLWDLHPDSETTGFWCRVDAEAAGYEPCPFCNGEHADGRVPARVRQGGDCDEVCRDGEDCREYTTD